MKVIVFDRHKKEFRGNIPGKILDFKQHLRLVRNNPNVKRKERVKPEIVTTLYLNPKKAYETLNQYPARDFILIDGQSFQEVSADEFKPGQKKGDAESERPEDSEMGER